MVTKRELFECTDTNALRMAIKEDKLRAVGGNLILNGLLNCRFISQK